MNNLVYHFFDDDEFLRISNKIAETELITSGEIRVSIKEHKSFSERNSNIKALAEKEFYRLNMHQTRDKTGILLFFLLGERQFYILADIGINEKVNQEVWENVSDKIQQNFKNGYFSQGIILGIEEVGNILEVHFPIKSDDKNELTNKVVLPL
ncbi:MAG: TPM domain-containing protein [Ignavibacteriales bacterium]|nr:TPM domain-containing protein [Ignavibacteriales bacterium]MCB9207801.1 TPM domain-containing protein [Ignavibacteriales bacterium]MCB9258571.1 TPM domain-containing protein [Ignavibacteriales bacterium]